MDNDFEIRPGRYVVPNQGTINTKQPLTNDVKVALYLNKSFPFITLKPDGVKVLKKAKLSAQQVASLIRKAKTPQEVDLILKVRTNKTLRTIAEVTKHKLK